MAKNTRLATTVTARYFPDGGAVDAFYLDGRMNGRREESFADITLDREDRGSFYALYASSHGSKMPNDGSDGNKDQLNKISKELKENNRQNIDAEINELAECAVGVTGRLTLSDATPLQPYFSGVIVKDGEIAAVTIGRGCAYLYRDDALFPLTQDDLGLEAVDYYGKSLPNMEDFSAGVAGTIRYSNIAQLKANDCLILCNRELMETVGQKRMLQLLDQADDQSDAAGMIMGLATHENQEDSLQFLIGFVEDLVPLDRLGRSTLARGFAKLSRETASSGKAAQAAATGRVAMGQNAGKDDLFANFAPAPTAPAKAVSPADSTGFALDPSPSSYDGLPDMAAKTVAPPVSVSDLLEDDSIGGFDAEDSTGQVSAPKRFTLPDDLSGKTAEEVAASVGTALHAAEKGSFSESFAETEYRADDQTLPSFTSDEESRGSNSVLDEVRRKQLSGKKVFKEAPAEAGDGSQIRKIIIAVLLLVALLLIGFIAYTLLSGNQSGKETTTTRSLTTSSTTLPTNQLTPAAIGSVTTASTTAPTVQGGNKTYVVQAGDTLSTIIAREYKLSGGDNLDAYINAVAEASGLTDINHLQIGQELILPPVH